MSFVQPCPYCGNIHVGSVCEQEIAEYKRIEAFRSLIDRTPNTPVTYGLIAINVIMFVLLSIAAGTVMAPSNEAVVNYGGDWGPLTLTDQPWRIVTAMFVHIGLIHVGCNMYALYMVGPFAEKMFGNLGMLVVYFAAGVVGGVASLWFNPLVPSAGASGAIFGMFGAIFGLLIVGRKSLPSDLSRKMLPQMGWILAINLFLGFTVPNIDNAAHIGGLLFGIVAGAIGAISLRWQPLWRFVSFTAISLAAVALSAGVYLYLTQTSVAVYFRDANEISSEFNLAAQRSDQGDLSVSAFAKQLEESILPRWSEANSKLQPDTPDSLGLSKETAAKWTKFHNLRESAWLHLKTYLHTNDPGEFSIYHEEMTESEVMLKGYVRGEE